MHFNPLSLYRERRKSRGRWVYIDIFQSTLPIQGETPLSTSSFISGIFQSTLPIQGETRDWDPKHWGFHISIHSPYTGRDVWDVQWRICIGISIHSPYTGRDGVGSTGRFLCLYFNPLSLYRERLLVNRLFLCPWLFQSTLPIQGETKAIRIKPEGIRISIHSPYTGRDCFASFSMACLFSISIHSPYTGRDATFTTFERPDQYFNPLSLYRERRNEVGKNAAVGIFQSTLPIQGETKRDLALGY